MHIYFELFAEYLERNAKELKFYASNYQSETVRALEICFEVGSNMQTPLERYVNYRNLHGTTMRRAMELRWEDVEPVEYLEVGSIADLCDLEILMLARSGASMKRCLNCYRLFILKGGYQTDFCGNIPPGETRTCQSIGAAKNYRRKLEDTPDLRLYTKYYKRNYSRIRYSLMSREAFEEWKAEASARRNDCAAGRITVEEYERWLRGSH